jgi:hypothetical protein
VSKREADVEEEADVDEQGVTKEVSSMFERKTRRNERI